MKSKISIIILLVLSIVSGQQLLNAQENCALNLKNAQTLLSDGRVEEIPALLETCLQSGFTREEKVQAYKVLINAYIFDDSPENAGKIMINFLKSYPEYQPISTDPSEFISLIGQFDNKPRFSLGVIAGGTYSVIRPTESVSTSPEADNFGNYKTSSISYHAGLAFTKYLNSSIDLCVEADFKNTVFDRNLEPDEFTGNSYVEYQKLITLPVSSTYTFGKGKYAPYVRLGINPGFLISSGADLTTTPGAVSPRLSNLDNRETFGLWGIIGGGVKLKLSKAYLFLDMRYNLAFLNQVNGYGRTLTQADELWLYQTRDDSFYHDDLNFSVGFVKTFYKPRKK